MGSPDGYTYPDLFPETPADIRPRDSTHFWSCHQYGPGGSLCLEWRADNWESRVTGADLIRSAYKLLSTERNPDQPAEVPSAHEVTQGQQLRTGEHRFVCTPELMSMLASCTAPATRRLRTSTILHENATVVFVSHFELGNSMHEIADLPKGISVYGPLFNWRRDAYLFKSEFFDHGPAVTSMHNLANVIQAAGFTEQPIVVEEAGHRLVLLVGRQPESLRVLGISIDEDRAIEEYSVLLPEESPQRIPPEHEQLREVRVGIVGLGSLGSKIAVSLARSGIRKLLLIDDDVLVPGNISRHELSWGAVGTHKAEAVREALTLIAPIMDIQVRLHRIAGQESAMSAATALRDLTSCDLLVDATANPEVFLRIAAVAKMCCRPVCWGEVFAGGFGGLIARARPNVDPHPAAVRAAILHHLGTLPPAPHRRSDDYNIGGEEPAVAYDSEVAQIAAALTRFALDIALRKTPSAFPYSAYLIGLRKEWIFSQPFDTYPIEITGEEWSNATDPSFRAEDRTEAIKVLLRIVAEEKHANAGSST
jgi:molybdopterin/thiamine biosynthesis adenylyltransferase